MLGSGHWVELGIILVIALIVFGPQRLPEITSSMGKAVREFRRATSELEEAVMHHATEEEVEEQFPHIPPAPDTREAAEVTEVAPTIDTLAERRAKRKKTADTDTATVANSESDADGPELAGA